jgi:hypothetical protein
MFKRIVATLLLAPAIAFAADDAAKPATTAPAETGPKIISFEAGVDMTFGKGVWERGNGYGFGINIPTKALTIGYYFAQINATAESNDDGNTTATRVEGKLAIHELRLIKSIPGTNDMLGVGLGVGMGDLRTNVQGAAASTGQQQATIGDVFVKFSPLAGGDTLKASLDVIAGYRFVRFSGYQLDGGAGDYATATDNMDGLHVGLAANFGF